MAMRTKSGGNAGTTLEVAGEAPIAAGPREEALDRLADNPHDDGAPPLLRASPRGSFIVPFEQNGADEAGGLVVRIATQGGEHVRAVRPP